jgi:hypothetical protein
MFINFGGQLLNINHITSINYYNPGDDGVEDATSIVHVLGINFVVTENYDNWSVAEERFKTLKRCLPVINDNDLGVF